MAKDVIEKEAAEAELARIVDFFEVDPEGDTWADSRARMLAAIQKGRIVLDEDQGSVVMSLIAPLELESGKHIKELSFHEPTAGELKVLDKYREHERMAKTIHLASAMTKQAIGVIERIGARDLQVLGAVAELFF
jgi:hypothetical protein